MQMAGQFSPEVPTVPDVETRILRARLLLEETIETINALGVDLCIPFYPHNKSVGHTDFILQESTTHEPNLVEIADGCADVAVIATGTLVSCGIPDKPLLALVDQNNLDKFGPGHYIDSFGKVRKPPNHVGPDIAGLLKELSSGTDK
jgi:predicted HAD superfamily Cof-like phosphohydrolase